MKTIFLAPTFCDDNLKTVATSIVCALEQHGLKVGFFEPVQQFSEEEGVEKLTHFISQLTVMNAASSLEFSHAIDLLRKDDSSNLMEEIVTLFEQYEEQDIDVVIVEGLCPSKALLQTDQINLDISSSLNASVLFVASPSDDNSEAFSARIGISANVYGGFESKKVLGLVLANVGVGITAKSFLSDFLSPYLVGIIPASCSLLNLDEMALKEIKSNEVELKKIASYVDGIWLKQQIMLEDVQRTSPAQFRHNLTKRASREGKRIVLPEGDEPRTVQAAVICHQKGIAKCVLLAKRSSVEAVAKEYALTLPEDIEVIKPNQAMIAEYVPAMMALRKSQGLTVENAQKQLSDSVVLGTMMLAVGHVDGLVSGAVHTTANTVRPAFQLIKAHSDADDVNIVSSVFFMLLPENVLIYGDCAINPNPTAEQLAIIAIQSADSAIAFGIEPKVAMISYSTGVSGAGPDVDLVKQATDLAKAKRPDLIIDGPLQYDAAYVASVAKKKAPNSPVAGQANVFIFPDLNTGNISYKAVQRSANVVSIGPMLQGLNKPVNDLSRGALVDDIVYTIALTAIQAANNVSC